MARGNKLASYHREIRASTGLFAGAEPGRGLGRGQHRSEQIPLDQVAAAPAEQVELASRPTSTASTPRPRLAETGQGRGEAGRCRVLEHRGGEGAAQAEVAEGQFLQAGRVAQAGTDIVRPQAEAEFAQPVQERPALAAGVVEHPFGQFQRHQGGRHPRRAHTR